jgi:hypothetical protein
MIANGSAGSTISRVDDQTEAGPMRWTFVVVISAGFAFLLAPDAIAQGKKAKKSAQPACLNALACGPQPVPKMRKPKSERFMKSAS